MVDRIMPITQKEYADLERALQWPEYLQRFSLERVMKVCPKNKEHKEFLTTAHEVHDWRVDGNGNFIADLGCSEVAAKPDDGNIWICAECGAEAVYSE